MEALLNKASLIPSTLGQDSIPSFGARVSSPKVHGPKLRWQEHVCKPLPPPPRTAKQSVFGQTWGSASRADGSGDSYPPSQSSGHFRTQSPGAAPHPERFTAAACRVG